MYNVDRSTPFLELTGAEVKTDDLITSWRVDNRYYSADVTIQTLSVGHVIEITNPEALVFLYEVGRIR